MSRSMPPPILVAGIGNIFLGDDGFGCEVLRQFAARPHPANVAIIDFGIRGLDLAYALLEPYETVILVDAIARGGTPGSVYILQPVVPEKDAALGTPLDAHSMDPLHLLAMARSLGEITAQVFIVGCEPLDFGDPFEGRMTLSDVVKAALPEAIRAIVELVDRVHLRETPAAVTVCEAP